MGFYDYPKDERQRIVERMKKAIANGVESGDRNVVRGYASDGDTYIRKNTYLIIGRLFREREDLRDSILRLLQDLYEDSDERVRQTAIHAAGEIGKINASAALEMLGRALFDKHHSVRNAAVGSLKRMGQDNPTPVLEFAERFMHHPDPLVRRIVIHGIELRGRTHPEDILPLLAKMQGERDKRVRRMIIHVLGQISYKEGCLEKVISALSKWTDRDLVRRAAAEILSVHRRYERFSAKSYVEARKYIEQRLKE